MPLYVLRSLHFQGYRSLRDFRMKLGRVTVVTGENGVGKSNVYRVLEMVQRMAQGRFAAAVAAEGGLPSMLWAGELKKNDKRRVSWKVAHEITEPGGNAGFWIPGIHEGSSLPFGNECPGAFEAIQLALDGFEGNFKIPGHCPAVGFAVMKGVEEHRLGGAASE